jgi:chromosome segregation ATPase
MGKDDKKKKVHSRATPKYTTSSDEGSSSDNEDDLLALFANLTMEQKKKLNELIETINEKDDLLQSQEDFLIKENKNFVKLKNSYALEVEKNENLSKELSTCHNSISCLRIENDNLVSKIEELNVCNDLISCLRDENARLKSKIEELNTCKPSTSTGEHVSICTRCRDINVEAIDDHLAMIKQQNDHIAKLTTKIAEHELENEKFKFARSMLYNGRRPGIKDGIGFQQGSQNNVKLNAPKRLSNFVKGKAPMVQDSEGYILYPANYP